MNCEIDIELSVRNTENCVVCLESLNTDTVLLHCCNQSVHERCLVKWLCTRLKPKCMICRSEITAESLKDFKLQNFLTNLLQISYDTTLYRIEIVEILEILYPYEPLVDTLFVNSFVKEGLSSSHVDESICKWFSICFCLIVIVLIVSCIVIIVMGLVQKSSVSANYRPF